MTIDNMVYKLLPVGPV